VFAAKNLKHQAGAGFFLLFLAENSFKKMNKISFLTTIFEENIKKNTSC